MSIQRRERPLISIITACKNADNFIEQCIQSVLAQDFEQYEYVVIDGGSADGTVEIIKHFEDRIAYWHSRADRGLAHAFNLGIQRSTGKWILFLNSDDFLASPAVLTRMAPHLAAAPEKDVVFGQVTFVRRNSQEVTGGPFGKPFAWKEFLLRDTIPHPAAFTSRVFFEREGVFCEEFRIAMDYEMFLRAGKCLKARFVPCPITFMREGGVSRRHVFGMCREWRRAHLKNGTLSRLMVEIVGSYLFLRSGLGMAFRFIREKALGSSALVRGSSTDCRRSS